VFAVNRQITRWIRSETSFLTLGATTVKVKVKLSLCLTKNHPLNAYPSLSQWSHHEDILGEWGIAPRILNLGTRWRWVVSLTPRPLYSQVKRPRNPEPIGYEAGLASEPEWSRWRRERNTSLPLRKTNPGRPARSLVIILSELSRLPAKCCVMRIAYQSLRFHSNWSVVTGWMKLGQSGVYKRIYKCRISRLLWAEKHRADISLFQTETSVYWPGSTPKCLYYFP
jgi:hypothetical protein